jgi:hypothetical protein
VHLVDDEVGGEKVPVDEPVHLEVVVVLTERIDQGLGHLGTVLHACTPSF